MLHDWYSIFCKEMKMIFTDSGALIIFFLGGLLYPVLYNLVYHDGLVEDMPIAVVDMSQGSYSRRFLQKLDATRECEIAYNCVSMEEAKDLMQKQKIHGIVYVPKDYDEKLARGEQGTLSTYADMSSFLYYKCLTMGSSYVMLNEIHDIQVENYSMDGITGESASQMISPVQNEENMPYNRSMSYTIFFISAALMLVIQQTMFYGSSMIAGTMRERHKSFARDTDNLNGRGINRVVLGRGAAYLAVYLVTGTIITLLVPWLFHLPQHAPVGDIMILLVFFILDCIVFSFTWSTFITRRETVFVLFLFMSPICMFLTGFSWPESSFPEFWRIFSYIFPSTFGCRAFINLNTAGCSIDTIAPEMIAMTIQTVVYYFLACVAVMVENKVIKNKNKLIEMKDVIARRSGIDLEREAYIIGGEEGVEHYRNRLHTD